MQRGNEGSERGIILSLLSDYALHFHPDQLNLQKTKRPAASVGSLREKVMMESLMAFIGGIVSSSDPRAAFERHAATMADLFQLRSSRKHMRGVDTREFSPMAA